MISWFFLCGVNGPNVQSEMWGREGAKAYSPFIYLLMVVDKDAVMI
jgi:hypothetical protein